MLRSELLEMYQILEAIYTNNLQPSLNWVIVNHEKLKENGSSLELILHQVRFMELLQQGNQTDALKYARAHLAPLAFSYMDEIQKLMPCLPRIGRLEKCPYFQLLAITNWEKLGGEISRLFFLL